MEWNLGDKLESKVRQRVFCRYDGGTACMMYDVSSIIHHPVPRKSSSILGMDHCHPTRFYKRRQLH